MTTNIFKVLWLQGNLFFSSKIQVEVKKKQKQKLMGEAIGFAAGHGYYLIRDGRVDNIQKRL